MKFLVFLLLIASSLPTMANVSWTGCPGRGGSPTPFTIMLVKRKSGSLTYGKYENGRRVDYGHLTLDQMRSLNPDMSFVKGAGRAVLDIIPVGRVLDLIRTTAQISERIYNQSHGIAPMSIRMMSRAHMEACVLRAYRSLRSAQGVLINFESQSGLTETYDRIRNL